MITFVNYFSVCLLHSGSSDLVYPVYRRPLLFVKTRCGRGGGGASVHRLIPCALRYIYKANEKLLLPPYPSSISKYPHIKERKMHVRQNLKFKFSASTLTFSADSFLLRTRFCIRSQSYDLHFMFHSFYGLT